MRFSLLRIVALIAGATLAVACAKSHPSATEPPTSGLAPLSTRVAAATVSPNSASITVGATVQLQGSPRDINGNVTGCTACVWSTTAPDVATITQNGLVTGIAAGSAIIKFSADGYIGQSTISVIRPAR